MTASGFAAEDFAFFESRIRPVLSANCYECHSAEAAAKGKLKGGLQLDTREGARRGGDTRAAVVPGDVERSLLMTALRQSGELKMPPKGKLPEATLADLEKWITMGAPDPRDGRPVEVVKATDFAKAREFWSLRPVRLPAAPTVRDLAWPWSKVDAFVAAGREAHGLSPAGDAEARMLLRRVHFDLIGLPPPPEMIEGFLRAAQRDPRAAFTGLVDALLASPHFGERWGRHWLDVARFAESNGRARNMLWPHAWRYRDWVIDAFNRDQPYDQFIREQIAGDLLPATDAGERDRRIIATGFLALGPKSLEEPKRELFRMDVIDEQIEVIGRAFLGLSIACARCHDHKFDPVPTRDYYALAGILRSTDTLYGLGPMGIKGVNDAALQPVGAGAERLAAKASAHLETVKEQTQKRNTARSDRYRVVRKVADLKRQSGTAKDGAKLMTEIERLEAVIKEWDAKIKALDAELAALVDHPPPQPGFAMAARDHAGPEDCRVHIRGEITNLGPPVPRGVLQVIEIPGGGPVSAGGSGRRLLADWLASRANPLTARVFVNRVWQHLFGQGLVTTPDDFGKTGARPSHPELLDYLAARFMDHGWSVKRLIREIVLSRTYQLGGEAVAAGLATDPENVWLWRMPLRRLEVEAFRDAVLAVNGRLERTPLVRSVIAGFDPFKHPEFNSATKITPEQMEHPWRSVYLPVVRGILPELFQIFDFADPNALIGRRDQTTVPTQALFLMNSDWIIEQARVLAASLLDRENLTDAGRAEALFERALTRRPHATELRQILAWVRSASGAGEAHRPGSPDTSARLESWTSVCQIVLAGAEFRHVR